jgi:hypothetical protein
MKRLYALAIVCALVGGITLIGCSKAPEEKPASSATQSGAAQTGSGKSPAKGSMTDSAGP